MLLELDLTGPLVEHEPDDPIAKLASRGRPRLRAVLRTLHEAGTDRGSAAWSPSSAARSHWAGAQELRAGVREFAASGKPTVAWAESLGDVGNGTVDYLLASGFDEIWLQPSGGLGLLGIAAETTFLRGTLDKLGIDPQIQQRYEYKNAADRITRTSSPRRTARPLDGGRRSAWEDVRRRDRRGPGAVAAGGAGRWPTPAR